MAKNVTIPAEFLTPVAGNGLLDRRLFLKYGAAFGALLASDRVIAQLDDPANPAWMKKPGLPFSNYGQPSPHEAKVIRWIAANSAAPGNGVSWCPLQELEGMLTPAGLHFERHHNGVPEIDPAQHKLLVHGLVEQPLFFNIENLLRYPMQSQLIFLECGGNSNFAWRSEPTQTTVGYIHGLVSCSEWTGIPLAIILDEAGIKPQGRWLVAESADAFAMHISIPIEKALDDAILALYQNGEKLRPEHGYPLRLILPGWEGVLNVKWLRRLKVVKAPVMARNETARYTDLLPSGKARQFSFVMEAKSVITHPSASHRLSQPGFYEIRGLAWSGRGRIRNVEVSADGGASWAEAALQEPVLPRCFTRFRIPWRWQGDYATLQSRATDETGYVQPSRKALIEQRGRNSYFHNNAISSWEVDNEGFLSHVYS